MSGGHWSEMEVAWIRSMIPELGGVPLYVRSVNEIPAGFSIAEAAAWTGYFTDLKLKPYLEQDGTWKGRGAAIVLEQIWDTFPESTQQGVLIHEASHVLANWGSWNVPESDLTLNEEISLLPGGSEWMDSAHLAILGKPRLDHAAIVKRQHGLQFVRAGLHLWNRCCDTIRLYQLMLFADIYSLQEEHTQAAIRALVPEIRNGGNLVEILKTDPPKEFAALFNRSE